MNDRSVPDGDLQQLLRLGAGTSYKTQHSATNAIHEWMQRRDALGSNCSPADAFSAVSDLLALMRNVAEPLLDRAFNGDDNFAIHLLRSLKPSDPEADRSDQLRLLASKLTLAARFFDGSNSAMPLSTAITELAAINAGDDPRLFAPIETKRSKGLGSNAYRLASSQLRALEWDAVLNARGQSASDRHLILHQAFGVQWDAMRKWPGPCEKRLGISTVTRRIEAARDKGVAGRLVFAELFGLASADAITFDGRLYQEELRRRKS